MKTKNNTNLLRLNPDEKNELIKRVGEWKGLVRIFVHPLFEKWHWPAEQYGTDPSHKRLIQIEEAVSRLLSMPERKTPPIIIMEESIFIENLKGWLDRPELSLKTNAYYVETRRNNPTPLLETCENQYGSIAWKKLIDTLTDLGVRKILLGGMQFEVWFPGLDWTGKPPFCDRCVGITLSYLSKDKAGTFEVELSALVDSTYARKVYIQHTNESRLASLTTVCA